MNHFLLVIADASILRILFPSPNTKAAKVKHAKIVFPISGNIFKSLSVFVVVLTYLSFFVLKQPIGSWFFLKSELLNYLTLC